VLYHTELFEKTEVVVFRQKTGKNGLFFYGMKQQQKQAYEDGNERIMPV
jgi:hypothetical protein